MKKVNLVILVLIAFVFGSCSIEQEPLSKSQLIEFLESRNADYVFYNTEESASFSKEIISEPRHFNSLKELEIFLDAVENIEIVEHSCSCEELIFPPEDPGGDGGCEGYSDYYQTYRYIAALGTYLNIEFKINNCNGCGLTSWLSNHTQGLRYQHSPSSYLTSNNNEISYYVNGVWHYNVFVNGVQEFFSGQVSFSGKYQCK